MVGHPAKRKAPREPKPCPRCYAPMRMTATGYACDKHGAPPTDPPPRRERVTRERTSQPRPSRPKRISQPKSGDATTQTRRLVERKSEIIERNQSGESLFAIASSLWHELGYKNEYVCASKLSRFLKLRGVEVADAQVGPAPGSRATPRFTEERLAEVRDALASGATVWAIAGLRWQEWGFNSRGSCDSLIRKWLRSTA
jgi:hypothetical protein